ncbi:MAG: TolC family protein [Campylobacterota bacterium]|nr:TolC family protein [Campylobacterota bacterium]
MIKKLILIFLFSVSLLYSNNDIFNDEIDEKLSDEFKRVGITYLDETNTIRFNNNGLTYLVGKNSMTDIFKNSLDITYPKFLNILLGYKDDIEKIYIKGYSSSEYIKTENIEDKYQLNLILSQERAEIVHRYLNMILNSIDISKDDKFWLNSKISALGMSSSNLIYDENGKEDKEKSRRIEIEVVFKNKPIEVIVEDQKSDVVESVKKVDYEIDPVDTIYLSDYVRRLLVENPTLAEKYNFLKSIQKDMMIAKSAFKPTVDLNFKQTQYQESKPDALSDSQSKDITARYNIFNGFKDIEEVNINKYNYKSNQYLKEQVEADLIYALTEAFITIQKQKEILQLSAKNLIDYDNWIEKENIKFQNGMTSLRNYAKVESRDTVQRMNYQELNREYQDSISMFKRYLDFSVEDIPFFEKLKPYSKYLKNKDIAYYDANRLSPFLKEANTNIVLYKEKMNKQKVDFYPTVDLVAKKSILDENFEVAASAKTEETYVALEAKLALYSGGKDKHRYEKTVFEHRQKIRKRDEVARDVKYKVDLAFNKYELLLAKDELLVTLINKREESLVGATYDYDFAKIDANGLLDSVDGVYDAKKLYITNKYDILLSQYKILNNVGVIKNYILEDWTKE